LTAHSRLDSEDEERSPAASSSVMFNHKVQIEARAWVEEQIRRGRLATTIW